MARTIVDQVNDLAKGLDRVARNARRVGLAPPASGAVAASAPVRPEIDALDFRRREV